MNDLADRVIGAVKRYVADAMASVVTRIELLETRAADLASKLSTHATTDTVRELIEAGLSSQPTPRDGRDGKDGASVTLDDLRPLVDAAVQALPAAKDGRDGKDGKDGTSVALTDVQPLVDFAVKALPPPVDGKDGRDGVSITLDDVRPLIREAVDAIPRPKDGSDGTSISVEDVRPIIEQAVKQLPAPEHGNDGQSAYETARARGFKGTEAEWLESLRGAPGTAGKSVTPEELQPLIEESVRALPPPKNGRSAYEIAHAAGFEGTEAEWLESLRGAPGTAGKSVAPEELQPLIETAVRALPPPKDGERGEDGSSAYQIAHASGFIGSVQQWLQSLRGEKGDPGDAGRSVSIDDVRPIIEEAVHSIPKPRNGRDGVDGKGVTVDDFRQIFEAEQARWALEWERRATDLLQRCIDRIEKPKDGKDGRDALDLDSFDVVLADDGRTIKMTLARGDIRVEKSLRLPIVLERGIYRQGQSYERGDGVTFGGSFWIAQRDTATKPGDGDSWRLAVKRGRDGKDGERGLRGERGERGEQGVTRVNNPNGGL